MTLNFVLLSVNVYGIVYFLHSNFILNENIRECNDKLLDNAFNFNKDTFDFFMNARKKYEKALCINYICIFIIMLYSFIIII